MSKIVHLQYKCLQQQQVYSPSKRRHVIIEDNSRQEQLFA